MVGWIQYNDSELYCDFVKKDRPNLAKETSVAAFFKDNAALYSEYNSEYKAIPHVGREVGYLGLQIKYLKKYNNVVLKPGEKWYDGKVIKSM